MPALAISSVGGDGLRALTPNTLTASDSFTYAPGDIMHLRNPTGGAINPTLDGADGTVFPREGLGNVDISAGVALGAIPAGGERVIFLDTRAAFLQGLVTVTGGTGLICTIMRR